MFRNAVIFGRYAPWPSDTGAFLYSAMIAGLVSRCAAKTLVVGANHQRASQPPPDGIDLVACPARRPSALRYALSGLLFAAEPFNTPDLRRRAGEAAVGADLVVLDHIGAAWALDIALAAQRRGARLVYVAHNVETDARLAAVAGGGPRAVFARFDARRIGRAERRLLAGADLVVSISTDDRDRFVAMGARAPIAVLNPVHAGAPHFVELGSDTRRAVLVGSFFWRAKQENLLRFLARRPETPEAQRITLRIVGAMPDGFRQTLSDRYPALEITGAVARIEDHLAGCRIGVIPEEEGGGFKLKALDYAYAGLPIFGVEQGLRGLPLRAGQSMRAYRGMSELWTGIARTIDDLVTLEDMRNRALADFEANSDPVRALASFQTALAGGNVER